MLETSLSSVRATLLCSARSMFIAGWFVVFVVDKNSKHSWLHPFYKKQSFL